MQLRANIILLLLCCLACNNKREEKPDKSHSASKDQMEFDKIKWRMKNVDDYPYRDGMLQDLISNVKLHGLKRNEMRDLLGRPNRIDSNYLFYRISQKRLGFFPLHTKTLVIKFNKDSTVEWRKIHE